MKIMKNGCGIAFAIMLATLLLGAATTTAVTFTNLYSFSGTTSGENSDGIGPQEVVSSGGRLYGTASDGGPYGLGTVFAINTDGTGFADLHDFGPTFDLGSGPSAPLVLSGGVLYGTTRAGGTNGLGTVFALTNGAGFSILHDFGLRLGTDHSTGGNTNSGGAYPETALLCSSNTLYGATEQGGSGGYGTLFKVNTDGTGFALLHSFTNGDGNYPSLHMVLIGTNLYGTTAFGGIGNFVGGGGNGVIFRVNTDGSGFTNLYQFKDSDGANPKAGLVLSSNILYGTTALGGLESEGAIFQINTDGTGFILHDLSALADVGGEPSAGLAINGRTLYFTGVVGASFGGTVFQVNTDGTGYTNLTAFNSAGDPGTLSGLVYSGGKLYCTTSDGGRNGTGTVFALSLFTTPIPLDIAAAGNAVILSWSDPAFSLYAAPAVNAAFTNVPNATSPYTNHLTGPQKFFRLQSN